MKRLLLTLPLLLLAGLAATLAVGLTRNPSELPSTLIDRALPAFELPGVSPRDSGLSSAMLAGEPALLNVFASWCAACQIEHPMLMQIARQGVPIYGLDWKDTPTAGAAWLAEHGNPYRRVGSDLNGRVGIDLGVAGAPETFIVDAKGRVRYKHVGPITLADWEGTLLPLLVKLRAAS